MTEHKHIVEAFENYLESDRPGHAIMISGDWGSGKTHFWRTVLDPYVEGKQRHKIHVSLYGTKSHDDIEKQVIASIYPFMESGLFKMAKEAGEKYLGVGLSLFKLEPKLHRAVFCFDDLERVADSPADVLGYVNRFIEQYGSHVVILANEERIKDPKYWEMKEKVVGKTYLFNPDVVEAMKSIVSEMGAKKHQSLDTKIPIIQNAVSKNTPVNLRSAIQAVDNSNLVLKRLDGKPALPADLMDSVMRMVAACTMQEKSGKETLQHLRALFADPHGLYFSGYVRQREGKEDEPLAAVEDFASRYFDGNADLIPPLTAVLDFVETGRLDVEDLYCQASTLTKTANQEPDELNKQFLKDPFMLSSDAEVLSIAEEFLKKVEFGGMTNATELSHLFSVLDFLSRHGVLKQSREELTNLFETSISKMSEEGRFNESDFAGYMALSRFVAPISDELKVVVKFLDLAKDRVEETAHTARIGNLLSEMGMDYELFVKRMTGNVDDDNFDYAHEPVFSRMDPDAVAKMLLSKHPKEIRLFESLLRQRYLRVLNINEFLAGDYKFLLALDGILGGIQKDRDKSMQGVALGMLRNVIAEAATKISPQPAVSDSNSMAEQSEGG